MNARVSAIICSFVDDEGRSPDGKWRWEYHHYLGPSFLKKNGDPLANQPGERSTAWAPFYVWLKEHQKTCKTCIRERSQSAKDGKHG